MKCDKKKNRLSILLSLMTIRKRRGGDIISSVISKFPTELHLHTLTGKKYNWCGPNTNLSKRLNPNKIPRDFSKPTRNKSIVPPRTMHTGRILSRAYAAIREWS